MFVFYESERNYMRILLLNSEHKSCQFCYHVFKANCIFINRIYFHKRRTIGGKRMTARVAVVMGSTSDWPTMKLAFDLLEELGIQAEKHVISAHRMPVQLQEFGQNARENGLEIIIAGAGGAAHLPGMLAASTTIPVIGVPVKSSNLNGLDSLLSIVQMPGGVPVGTMAIGNSGAKNAALYAASILSLHDAAVAANLADFRAAQTASSIESEEDLKWPKQTVTSNQGRPSGLSVVVSSAKWWRCPQKKWAIRSWS